MPRTEGRDAVKLRKMYEAVSFEQIRGRVVIEDKHKKISVTRS